ncbi:hypothetical protein FB107DRAFT_280495 [Schizophyllum commune]
MRPPGRPDRLLRGPKTQIPQPEHLHTFGPPCSPRRSSTPPPPSRAHIRARTLLNVVHTRSQSAPAVLPLTITSMTPSTTAHLRSALLSPPASSSPSALTLLYPNPPIAPEFAGDVRGPTACLAAPHIHPISHPTLPVDSHRRKHWVRRSTSSPSPITDHNEHAQAAGFASHARRALSHSPAPPGTVACRPASVCGVHHIPHPRHPTT